jgi:hypothetical protein
LKERDRGPSQSTTRKESILKPTHFVFFAAVALASPARTVAADEVDPTTLYELSTQGSSQKVRSGDKGTFVLAIKTKKGSHISDEAPLKFELMGKNVKLQKEKLTIADGVGQKVPGGLADPRFEVPFTAGGSGPGGVDAKLTFFICTEKICARQQKTVSVPVEVN